MNARASKSDENQAELHYDGRPGQGADVPNRSYWIHNSEHQGVIGTRISSKFA
jgi:hypothetical protein